MRPAEDPTPTLVVVPWVIKSFRLAADRWFGLFGFDTTYWEAWQVEAEKLLDLGPGHSSQDP